MIDIKRILWIAVLILLIPAATAPIWYGSGDDAGLVGKWSCENNFLDTSGQGNQGTQSGGVTITDGYKGRGCGFDGGNDWINTSSSQSLNFSSGNFTLAAWIKTTTASRRTIVSKLNPASPGPERGYTLDVLATGYARIVAETSTSAYMYVDSTAMVNDGNWHHVAGHRNGSTVRIYIDGVDQSGAQTTTGTTTTTENYLNLTIGYPSFSGSSVWQGTIDEVRIYNRSLTASEISSLYNTSKTYKFIMKSTPTKGLMDDTPAPTINDETGLVGYWKLDGDVLDSSGVGNNGVIDGATNTSGGRWNGAFNFDGTNDKISSTATGWANNNISFSAWIKMNANPTAWSQIVGDYGNQGALYVSTAGNVRFQLTLASGTGNVNAGDVAIPLNTWVHFVGTWENESTLKIYKDGVFVSQSASAYSNPILGFGGFSLSYYASGGATFNGTIDEVRIYNRSLSASEVKELYLSKGLVGYWKMDADQKNTTDTFDSSGYYNHGKITGATITNEGKFKEAYKFDGGADYINAANDINLTGNFTLSSWVRPTETSAAVYMRILSWDNSPASSIGDFEWAYRTDAPYNTLEIFNKTTWLDVGAGSVTRNSWSHVALVQNGTDYLNYVNGVFKSANKGYVSPLGKVAIGYRRDSQGGGGWNGSIDEVRIYNRALTDAEIAGLYNGTKSNYFILKSTPTKGISNETPAPTASDETGLVGYWKMDDLTNGNTTDSSGQGNNGSVVGATYNSGRWDKGYSFDGVNDYIITNLNMSVQPNNTGVAISAWFYTNSTPTTVQTLVGQGGGNWPAYKPYILNLYSSSNKIYVQSSGVDSYYYSISASNVWPVNQWNHIVANLYYNATTNSTNHTIYMNGVKYDMTLADGGSSGNRLPSYTDLLNRPVIIGAATWNSYPTTAPQNNFSGKIDEVRIYNRSLSADEVKELYLSKGLVGYWKMDADQKNSTHTYDSSGYYNHGLLVHQPVLTNEGKFKEAYKFDGASDYVQMINTAPFNMTNFTISLWWNGLSAPNWGGPLNNRVAGQNGFQFVNDVSSTTTFRPHLLIWNGLAETAQYNGSETYSMPFGKFKHFVWTYNGTARLWVDGIEKTAATSLVTTYPTTGVLIGYGYYPVNGTIDEVRLYNRALTSTEVSQLYSGTKSNYLIMRSVAG